MNQHFYEFEKKVCNTCKEEKIKVVFFASKSGSCRECSAKKSKEYQKTLNRDPSRDWKRAGFNLKSYITG